MSEYAIWWTAQSDYELIASACDFANTHKETWDVLSEVFGLPLYISEELSSRMGRAGRGRLWVPQEIPLQEIDWDETMATCKMAAKCGGVVIHAKDVPAVISLPGFVTDLDMEFWKVQG